MSKYTTTTAALKATTADIRNLQAHSLKIGNLTVVQPDGEEKDLESVIGETTYLDQRFDNITENDLVGEGVEVTTDENGNDVVTHYNEFVYDFRGADSPLNGVELVLKGAGFTKAAEDSENVYDFFAYVDSENLRGGNARWIIKTLTSQQPPEYKNLITLDGYENQEVIQLEGTNIDIRLPQLMLMGANSLANIRHTDHLRLNLVAPKLRYIQDAIQNSNVFIITGDLVSVIEAPKAFRATTTEQGTLNRFECSLNSLMDGFCTFENQPIYKFTSALPLLMQGVNMFKNTNLTIESLENIANTLPVVDYTKSYQIYFQYPSQFDEFTWDYAMDERLWKSANTGEITISWQDTSELDILDKTRIINEIFQIMISKGWTIDTNITTGEEAEGIYAKVTKVAPDFADYTDAGGNTVLLRTAKYVYGPQAATWTHYASIADAISQLNLTAI